MSRFKLNRRTVLRGVLGGAAVGIALPPLDIFFNESGTAYADCGAFPARFGWWYFGNGVLPGWEPAETGDGYELSEQTAALQPLRDKLTFVSGTRVVSPNTVPHGSGPAGFLAGADMIGGSLPGASLDQIVADNVGGATRFRSIEAGVQVSDTSLSYTGLNGMNPPESSPTALYERLFGAGFRLPGESTEPDPALILRQSVLSAVTDRVSALQRRLGTRDRQRLEAHLDGVRSIENQILRLQMDPPNYAACARPTMPLAEYPDLEGRPQLSAVSRVMADMLAMALACDQTRVFSLMFSQAVSNLLFPNHSEGHHRLTHDEGGDQPQVKEILLQIHDEMAYFLQALDAVPEGDGTLLDHSAVICMSDVSWGRTHSIENMPLMIAGSACGRLRTGTHYRSTSGESSCKLSLTLLRAMDVPVDGFGEGAGRATDGIGAIEV